MFLTNALLLSCKPTGVKLTMAKVQARSKHRNTANFDRILLGHPINHLRKGYKQNHGQCRKKFLQGPLVYLMRGGNVAPMNTVTQMK